MTPRVMALAAFGVAVIGFAIYLLIEVNATPAHAQAADTPRATRTSQAAPTPPVEPPPAPPVVAAPHVEPTVTTAVARVDPQLPQQVSHNLFGNGPVHVTALPSNGSAANNLDAMAEANRAYDNGDLDDARARAEKIIATDPSNVRMLRIVVSVACLDGDQPAAQKAFDALPRSDKEQMKIRCARSGMTFNDSAGQ